ncbi:hypothetical protein PAHAL_9G065400 [Panicum hallii]|uniref:Uncharacterized protein n=1 Tax=Panicum hallii TaxID=206008 RepID=A0A2T8I0D7_9POAL|nr:hypothetical protein PAHAL_9G065400 [Panicum hallii]
MAREIDGQGAPTGGKDRRRRRVGDWEERRSSSSINCSWSGGGGRMEQGCSRGHGLFLNRGRKAVLHREKSRRLLCAWMHSTSADCSLAIQGEFAQRVSRVIRFHGVQR